MSDFVLARHLPFDPLVFLFAPFVKNRITVHHSKEPEELMLVRENIFGRVASKFEKFSGRFSARHALATASVTPDIAKYQNKYNLIQEGKCLFLPNGIDTTYVKIVDEKRDKLNVNCVFIATKFNAWHGLDLLLSLNEEADRHPSRVMLFIHIIGFLTISQKRSLLIARQKQIQFVQHGLLNQEKYREIFALCDFGFDSLAIHRKGLTEACTLKAREMLASGLPVLSTARDSAMPPDFQFHKCIDVMSYSRLVDYGLKMKSVSREQVRKYSLSYIDKAKIMKRFLNDITGLGR